MQMKDYLIMILTVQLFYGVGVTILSYTIKDVINPVDVSSFNEPVTDINITGIASKLQTNIQGQTKVPSSDFASMVFYSGNLFIDLMFNFVFAIPSMISTAMGAIFSIIKVNAIIANQLKVMIYALFTIVYFVGILNFILGLRSGNSGLQ